MRLSCVGTLLFLGAAAIPSVFAATITYDVQVLATNLTDTNLINPWGIGSGGGGPLWLGVNGSGISELYTGQGTKLALVVTIPGDGSVTGLTFNSTTGFNGDNFLFASEDGTVSGWRNPLGNNAETLVTANTANVYKGIAEGTFGGFDYAYLANFRAGTVDVVKGEAAAPDLPGAFLDPTIPIGFAPFDIQNIGGILYVSYAKQDAAKKDDSPGAGNGFVDKFAQDGTLLGRLVSNGPLDSPWGMAIAPAGFGNLSGDLLVGNFGNGMINAFDATSGAFIETLDGGNGSPLSIDGLWGLRFGTGGLGGNPNTLFFTAGPDGESGGVFGDITVPEPATWLLAAGALMFLGCFRFRKLVRA